MSLRPAAAAWPPNAIRPSEQSFRARVEVEAGDRARGALDDFFADREDHGGPVVEFDETAGLRCR